MRQAICFGLLAAAFCTMLSVACSDRMARAAAVKPDESAQAEPTEQAAKQAPFDEAFQISVQFDGGVQEISLRDYLTGVLCAEMPASFEQEALRAQAVAARTFALKQQQAGKHGEAAVCTNSACCQGYLTEAEYLSRVGADGEAYYARLRAAVDDTAGLVVTYADSLIDATFFSCSGGRTESAMAVWGGDVPYLQAVESPGEETALQYSDVTEIPTEDFAATLRALRPELVLPEEKTAWLGAQSETDGGGVAELQIGNCVFTGKELRSAFSLRSTRFTVSVSDETVRFTTQGYGHRVGLSQYGANARAQEGAGFAEILQYYYVGTEIKRLSLNESGQPYMTEA